MTRIAPAEAQTKMRDEGYAYVDVRPPDEFAAGHPEGATNVPWGDDFVAEVATRFAKDARIIVGCKMGVRSARAAKALVEAGFTHVLDQRAGWDGARGSFGEIVEPGWSRVGLPVTR
jgi:rhodanese-related sulfurtransferase